MGNSIKTAAQRVPQSAQGDPSQALQETNPVSHFSHTKGKHLIHVEGRHWLLCQALLRACGMDPAYSRGGGLTHNKCCKKQQIRSMGGRGGV